MSSRKLAAAIEPTTGGGQASELAVVLRIANASGETVEVFNPDMGRPSQQVNWPFSLEAYRASQLISFGYLTVSVTDESGEDVELDLVHTGATPILRRRLALSPGESIGVVIPIGLFFSLSPGGKYRVSIGYGDDALKARAEGTVEVPGD